MSVGKEKVSRFTDLDFKPVNQLLFRERAVNRSGGDELSETRSLSGRSGRGSSHPKKLRTSPPPGNENINEIIDMPKETSTREP